MAGGRLNIMSESESDSDDDRVDGAGVEERVTPPARTTPRVACTIGAGTPGAGAGVGAAGATCDGGGRGGEGGEDGAGAGLRAAADAVAAEPPVTEREGYMLTCSRANPYANPNPITLTRTLNLNLNLILTQTQTMDPMKS